jgi:hypothetical protein
MALLPGFEYDVFLSYSQTDNQPTDTGWVTRLKAELDRITPARLIRGDFKICFDLKDFGGAGELDSKVREKVQSSAFLLIVLSRSYLQSPWCLKELAAFRGRHKSAMQQIVVVDKDNVLKDQEFMELLTSGPASADLRPALEAIDKLYRYEFWQKDAVGRTYTLSDTPSAAGSDGNYLKRIQDLSDDLAKEILRLFKALREPVKPDAGVGAGVPTSLPGIFLALTPESLKSRRRDLQRFLDQSRTVTVYPTRAAPGGMEEFKDFVRSELGKSKLFVQLIGSTGQMGPDDLPDEFVRVQLDVADELRKPKLLWRSLDIDPADFTAAEQAINEAEMVRAETLNAFRTAVVDKFAQIMSAPRYDPPPPDQPIVFISATDKDMSAAKKISDEVFADCVCFFSPGSGNGVSQRNKVEQNFAYCDGALIVHHAEPDDDWAQGQLLRYVRARRQREDRVKFLVLFNRQGRPIPQVDRLEELEIISASRADDIKSLSPLPPRLK